VNTNRFEKYCGKTTIAQTFKDILYDKMIGKYEIITWIQ